MRRLRRRREIKLSLKATCRQRAATTGEPSAHCVRMELLFDTCHPIIAQPIYTAYSSVCRQYSVQFTTSLSRLLTPVAPLPLANVFRVSTAVVCASQTNIVHPIRSATSERVTISAGRSSTKCNANIGIVYAHLERACHHRNAFDRTIERMQARVS